MPINALKPKDAVSLYALISRIDVILGKDAHETIPKAAKRADGVCVLMHRRQIFLEPRNTQRLLERPDDAADGYAAQVHPMQ